MSAFEAPSLMSIPQSPAAPAAPTPRPDAIPRCALSLAGWAFIDGRSEDKLDLSLLPPRSRRGLSPLMRMSIAATAAALGDAPERLGELLLITASARGELNVALELLHQREAGNPTSPLRFRNSVHNAVSGVLGIASGNHHPATSIAAGVDTLALAILETSAWVSDLGRDALLLVAESALEPPFFAPENDRPGALALLVRAPGEDPTDTALGAPALPELRCHRSKNIAATAVLAEGESDPMAPVAALAAALEASQGWAHETRSGWSLELVPAASV